MIYFLVLTLNAKMSQWCCCLFPIREGIKLYDEVLEDLIWVCWVPNISYSKYIECVHDYFEDFNSIRPQRERICSQCQLHIADTAYRKIANKKYN